MPLFENVFADRVRLKRSLLFGAGGHALSVADAVRRSGQRIVGISGGTTNDQFRTGMGQIFPSDSAAADYLERGSVRGILAVGDNRVRKLMWSRTLSQLPDEVGTPFLARSAIASSSCELGSFSQVMERSYLGPESKVGVGVIVNTGAIVEHECHVDDWAHIAPGAVLLGDARIGSGTLIGAGAVVLPGVRIGADVVVGAGAVVTKDIKDGLVVTGSPATRRKGTQSGHNGQ